jgi:DUF4097 and DUF4098 domain-containing protein YvlB
MTGRRSAGSIFWGLVLVSIGGLLLAHNLGYSVPVWNALALYWPVLVIIWGVVKLVDYYRLSRAPGNEHLFSPGEVALLILVIFAGSALTAAANFSPGFAEFLNIPADFDLWDITGNNYEYTERHEADAAPGGVVEIVNRFGSVNVQASEGNSITLDVAKTVRAANKEEADSRAGQFTFSISNQDGRLRIVSSLDEGAAEGNGRQRYKSSLVVRVPRSVSLQINNRYGAVEASGLMGDQSISNRYGQVTLRGIEGAVTVENRYATVIAERISGGTAITNRYGSVTATEVGGPVRIENRYGSVDVRDVKGNAVISNSYSAISAANIEGSLLITGRNNSVDIEGVVGALAVETSYRAMNVRGAQDRLEARNLHGDITITFDRPPLQPVVISGEYGDVVLNLPSGSAFTLDARTRSGEMSSEFEELQPASSRREEILTGRVGAGGPEIRIETRNGDIRIGKTG